MAGIKHLFLLIHLELSEISAPRSNPLLQEIASINSWLPAPRYGCSPNLSRTLQRSLDRSNCFNNRNLLKVDEYYSRLKNVPCPWVSMTVSSAHLAYRNPCRHTLWCNPTIYGPLLHVNNMEYFTSSLI